MAGIRDPHPVADFAHYLRRDVVQVNYQDPRDPWFSENQPDDQGFTSPAFHVTQRSSGAAARVCVGDTIWLFAQLFSPWGKLPPALDAKIEVAGIEERVGGKGYRYDAGRGSMWFPLFDASSCLLKLKTKTAKGDLSDLLSTSNQPIGQALQSMRELSNGNVLEQFASNLASIEFCFVSYRLVDGTRRAFEKLQELVARKNAVFWDRWSLPRRLAERREFLQDAALDRYISRQISKASVVWGIDSPMYGEKGSYSKRELDLAARESKLRLHQVSPDK
jgi:hypothetical protein